MQLFLALILSCAALLAVVLAQTDWKPYSLTDGTSVTMADDSHPGTMLADRGSWLPFIDMASSDGNPKDLLTSDHHDRGPTRTLGRTIDVANNRKERTPPTESAGLLARLDRHAFTFTDAAGRTFGMKLDFDKHSFEMLVNGPGKKELVRVKKVFSTIEISALAERELRKEFTRTKSLERHERRQAQRDLQDDLIRVEPARAERVEAPCESEYLRGDRSGKADRSNQ